MNCFIFLVFAYCMFFPFLFIFLFFYSIQLDFMSRVSSLYSLLHSSLTTPILAFDYSILSFSFSFSSHLNPHRRLLHSFYSHPLPPSLSLTSFILLSIIPKMCARKEFFLRSLCRKRNKIFPRNIRRFQSCHFLTYVHHLVLYVLMNVLTEIFVHIAHKY